MNATANIKTFCQIGEQFPFSKYFLIECADTKLDARRGVNSPGFRLTHPCYNVSAQAMKKLVKDGYVEYSQEEYCRLHGIK